LTCRAARLCLYYTPAAAVCQPKSPRNTSAARQGGTVPSPSTVKNILYGKSQNPGIVTIKMLCDGMGISLWEFFNTEEFRNPEQEIL
jgi:transcriptional regulator with XRE-family HTH domain